MLRLFSGWSCPRLWIGHREQPDRLLSDDSKLLIKEIDHPIYGHLEGWRRTL